MQFAVCRKIFYSYYTSVEYSNYLRYLLLLSYKTKLYYMLNILAIDEYCYPTGIVG